MEILSWFVVEALAATALLVLVVWWTWPRRPKDEGAPNEQNDQRSDQRNGNDQQK
jgi:hypothetical protein